MSLADRLSGLNLRLRFKKSARLRRCRKNYQPVAAAALLEPRCLLASAVFPPATPITMPADYDPNGVNSVVWMGETGLKVPVKTITITNTLPPVKGEPTANMIYPFFRDTNGAAKYQDGTIYDPKDPALQEYRGYIGYEQGGTKYIGLPAGDSITVTVPLVFWDGAADFLLHRPQVREDKLHRRTATHRQPISVL